MGVVELGTALTLRPVTALQMLEFGTTDPMQFIDITADVANVVRDLGDWAGVATIFSRHTTAAIRIQEAEPLLLEDLQNLLTTVAPPDGAYYHNDFAIRTAHMHPDERPNGHAHCAHLVLGASEHVPVQNGELLLGTWQRIFLVELDGPRPSRDVLIQMTGMATGACW